MSAQSYGGLFQESLLFPIQDQAIAEFRDMRREMPENLICAFPRSFSGRIRRLFGVQRLASLFNSILYLEEIKESSEEGSLCIFIPNDELFAELAIKSIKLIQNYKVFVLIAPYIGYEVSKLFSKEDFGDRVVLREFHNDVLVVEPYLFLTPTPRSFVRVFVDNNIEDLTACARALTKIQVTTGGIDHVYALGTQSMRVKQIINEQKAQIGTSSFSPNAAYDSLIIVDRTIDLLTPLIKQTSYNGLIDEVLGNDCGFVQIPEEIKVDSGESSDLFKGEILLSDSDPVFCKIRDKIAYDVVDYIMGTTKAIGDIVNAKQQEECIAANKFKEKIERGNRLKQEKPYVVFHTNMMEFITKKIVEEQKKYGCGPDGESLTVYNSDWLWLSGEKHMPLISEYHSVRDTNVAESIREFCVISQCMDGVPNDPMDAFLMRLLYRFGFDFLKDIIRFNEIGLLKKEEEFLSKVKNFLQARFFKYEDIKERFSLIVPYEPEKDKEEEEQEKKGKKEEEKPDVNTVYGGYVPMTARIVKYAIDDGAVKESVKNKVQSPLRDDDVLDFLKNRLPMPKDKKEVMESTFIGSAVKILFDNTVGRAKDIVIDGLALNKEEIVPYSFPEKSGYADTNSTRKILVFVIGGVTNSEALAIRDLCNKVYDDKVEIVIGTTEILTSTSFIYDISPELKKADEMRP